MGKDEWETEILSNIQPLSQNKFAQYRGQKRKATTAVRCVWRQIGDTFKSLEIYPVGSIAPFIHLSNSVLSATMDNTIHAASYVQVFLFSVTWFSL